MTTTMASKNNCSINNLFILDVREKEEFEAESIPGSINAPLSEFSSRTPELLKQLKRSNPQPLSIMCRSGKRSQLAFERIESWRRSDQNFAQLFPEGSVQIFQGGILAWKEQGLSTSQNQNRKIILPMARQVQLLTGLLVVISFVMGTLFSPHWLWLGGVVGTGLTVAGLTGFCGLMKVLAWMPWNRC